MQCGLRPTFAKATEVDPSLPVYRPHIGIEVEVRAEDPKSSRFGHEAKEVFLRLACARFEAAELEV
ncbi:hypothetical protein ASF53_13585 [Methylobacterium sp. Leaf123]|nr:hypothetical protein ASF53_13585 [Methylobacterium sp. Leaf123]